MLFREERRRYIDEMNHQDRSIDFLTSAEADAVYEVLIEHIPLVPTRHQTIGDAINRTREELRQHIRQTLQNIRSAPIVDYAVGRIRLTQRRGTSPFGAPYDADCFFTCGCWTTSARCRPSTARNSAPQR